MFNAEELASQAQQIKAMVARFKLLDDEGNAGEQLLLCGSGGGKDKYKESDESRDEKGIKEVR